ncbi:MAG: cation:proton antiporter [Rubricoccaceae bacterium]|nr:cation:proton antiporter [Rubricoccaceae bacterium]
MPPPPLAATLPFLGELAALFAAAVAVAYLAYRVRLVPIAGFLLAGVLIGPSVLGAVDDLELVRQAAEVGVILLLFTIGVEFSLAKLLRIRRLILGGGGLQMGVTIAAVAGGLLALGVGLQDALFTGGLVALSSTAVVLGLLADRGETDTPPGQVALGILIFQDLAIVVMVMMLPIVAGQAGTPAEIVWALGKAGLIVVAVLVGARRVVPPVLEAIAQTRRQELFLLTVVALCLGTAWLTSLAGVSLALGAFLAGLLVSESPYSHHALSEVLPLQTVFAAVFFVSVGMLLDVGFLVDNLPLVLGAAGVVLLLKLVVTAGSAAALGYPARTATQAGLALAQIGEFSFVLAVAGAALGLTPGGLGEAGEQAFIAVTVLLMLATPLLMSAGPRLGGWLEGRLPTREREEPAPEVLALEDHVVVVGYGPAGRRLAQVLQNTGIPFVVVDLNPRAIEEAQAEGFHALYGDAARQHLLEEVALLRAKLLVVAINDPAAVERIARIARTMNPTLTVVVRARYLAEIGPLERAGADVVVPEELEAAVRLFTHVLQAYLIPPEEVQRQVSLIRADDYRVLRGSIHEAHLMVLQGLDEEGLHTRAVAVREGAPAAGKTLSELALRQRHGLTVVAVRRGRQTLASPAGDFRVEPGDRLVLIGLADEFAASAPLFRAEGAG